MSERAEKIQAIRTLPEELLKAISGLNDAQLDTPYREGGWSPKQIIHHLADSHMNAFVRMKLLLTEDNPTFKTYDQDAWAKAPDYRSNIATSLSIIAGLQLRMTDLLNTAAESDWSRSANHPENGTMTLDDLLNIYSAHGRNHVEQILSLRKQRGW